RSTKQIVLMHNFLTDIIAKKISFRSLSQAGMAFLAHMDGHRWENFVESIHTILTHFHYRRGKQPVLMHNFLTDIIAKKISFRSLSQTWIAFLALIDGHWCEDFNEHYFPTRRSSDLRSTKQIVLMHNFLTDIIAKKISFRSLSQAGMAFLAHMDGHRWE